jgi:Ran GTPase-activating protein (RanGAP) involved in mRNA processing and transport
MSDEQGPAENIGEYEGPQLERILHLHINYDDFVTSSLRRMERNDPTFKKLPETPCVGHLRPFHHYHDYGINEGSLPFSAGTETKRLWEILEHNTALEEIVLNLQSIDLIEGGIEKTRAFLTNNRNLKVLRVWIPPATRSEVLPNLFNGLAFLSSVEELHLWVPSEKDRFPPHRISSASTRLTDDNRSLLDPMADLVANCRSLVTFGIKDSLLSSNDMLVIASSLSLNRSVRHLRFSELTGSGHMQNLFRGLSQHPTIATIDLCRCTLCPEAHEEAWASLLLRNQSLESLNIRNAMIFPADSARHLTEILPSALNLQRLSLNRTKIEAGGGNWIAAMLHSNKATSLQELDLAETLFSSAEGAAIARGLMHNTHLRILNVSKNSLSDPIISRLDNDPANDPKSFHAWKVLLEANITLQVLDLSSNGITNEYLALVFEGLANNSTLKHLNLSNHADLFSARHAEIFGYRSPAIRIEVIYSIADVLENKGCGLVKLDLSHHRLEENGTICLAAALQNNTCLRRLILRHVGLGDGALRVFATILTNNSTLELLDISNNYDGLTEDGFQAFSDKLPSMRGLKHFLFDGGLDHAEQLRQFVPLLANGLKDNDTMETVTYSEADAQVRFYLELNRHGRRLLRQENVVPSALWADILAKIRKPTKVRLLHFFLRQKIDLLVGSARPIQKRKAGVEGPRPAQKRKCV